jgi:hypothetical protein
MSYGKQTKRTEKTIHYHPGDIIGLVVHTDSLDPSELIT